MASMGELVVKWDPESLAAIKELGEQLKALRGDLASHQEAADV